MDLAAIQEVLGHSWVVTTMNYIHVHRTHVEDAWISGQQRAAGKLKRAAAVTAGSWPGPGPASGSRCWRPRCGPARPACTAPRPASSC